MKKKLSIIIPVYNCLEVGKAIESIPESEEIELLVIDGGSSKETIEIINQYSKRIDYFVSEKDRGLYDAMNKGIQHATGEWILTLAADDQLLCNPLNIITKYGNNEYDVICGEVVAKDFKDRFFVISPDNDFKKLSIQCSLCHPGTFFRNSLYKRCGLYSLNYKCSADHEFFLRISKMGTRFLFIHDIIVYFKYGGLSTREPIMAFIEDLHISDQFGVPFFLSRKFFVNRIINFYGAKIKDLFHIRHKTKFMNKEQLYLLLGNHTEVENKDFLT